MSRHRALGSDVFFFVRPVDLYHFLPLSDAPQTGKRMSSAMTPRSYPRAYRSDGQNDLLEHYAISQEVGSGTYGVVYRGTQKNSGKLVAIKEIRNLDDPLVCRSTLREIKFLQHFKHDNIVTLLDVARPNSFHSFSKACLVEEYMPQNLSQVIAKYELNDHQISCFTLQMLAGLNAVHCAGIIHRDVKPENLLVGHNGELKICDFGLARMQNAGGKKRQKMTEYVATRWYRAPEIMVSRYGKASDLWSSGCVLAEMLGGKVLFPGKNYTHQLDLIFRVLGSPTDDDLKGGYSSKSIHYIRTCLPSRARTPWRNIFPKASEESLDLLDRLVTFNMCSRITVEAALQHEFVQRWLRLGEGRCESVYKRQTVFDCADVGATLSVKSEQNAT